MHSKFFYIFFFTSRNAFSYLSFDKIALLCTSFPLKHAVHALDSLTAVVDALGPDALAAGVVEPAVLGRPHGLTGDLALMYGHAVVKVDHSAHVFFVAGIRCMNIIAGNRHILVVWLVHSF